MPLCFSKKKEYFNFDVLLDIETNFWNKTSLAGDNSKMMNVHNAQRYNYGFMYVFIHFTELAALMSADIARNL